MVEYKNFTNECGIYCFRNLINGKCYVGQAINLKKRLRSHYTAFRSRSNLQLAFYKAVDEYGIDNFDLDILEYVDSSLSNLKEVLDDLERKYISELNCNAPNGYNVPFDDSVIRLQVTNDKKDSIATKNRGLKKRRIWVRNINDSYYYSNFTYDLASKKSGISKSVIRKICSGRYIHPYSRGWTFAYDEASLWKNVNVLLREFKKLKIR